MADAEFDLALEGFVLGAQAIINADYAKNFPRLTPPTLEVDRGRTYVRVWSVGTQRTAWAFIALRDVTTKAMAFKRGDVMKPATWRAPAKHARSNILDGHFGLRNITPYGPPYMESVQPQVDRDRARLGLS